MCDAVTPPDADAKNFRTQQDFGFIDEPELLRRLPVCRRTIHTWRQNGTIPSIKLGKRVLFRWESIVEALKRLEKAA